MELLCPFRNPCRTENILVNENQRKNIISRRGRQDPFDGLIIDVMTKQCFLIRKIQAGSTGADERISHSTDHIGIRLCKTITPSCGEYYVLSAGKSFFHRSDRRLCESEIAGQSSLIHVTGN